MSETTQAVTTLSMRFLGQVLLGAAAVTAIGLTTAQAGGAIAAIGIGLTILVSTFGLHAVFGFLFAVPRLASQAPAEAKEGASAAARFLRSNTNLEKISDWLTTMLIGVGLSQLYQVNEGLLRFRSFIAEQGRVFHDGSAGPLPVLSPFLLLLGLISGFLFMYLHTRVDLVRLFDEVERGLTLTREDQRTVAGAVRSAAAAGATLSPQASTVTPTVDDALDAMFDLLYKPEGYREVIRIGEPLALTPAGQKAQYWYYLAAAYGQQLADARARGDGDTEQDARNKALDAARRAVEIDPAYRARLWHISTPEGPDNDLSALRDDNRFLSIVGRARS